MKRKWIATFVATVVVIIIITVFLNPLRRSPNRLRLELLKKTPIGMQLNDVVKIAREIGNKTTVSLTTGFYKQEGQNESVVGVKSIRTEAGDYWTIPPIPIQTSVTYFWGFDDNGRLIEIWVWKTTDAP